jgi:hypothetical protein
VVQVSDGALTDLITVNVTISPVDDAPVVANPLSDVSFVTNGPDATIDLSNVFNDPDDDNASIVKTLKSNDNPNLVTATVTGDDLTLNFQPNANGTAVITVTGASNGQTVDMSFTVEVFPLNAPPVVALPVTHTVSVNVIPTWAANIAGTGIYEHGAQITIVATPIEGYRLVHWSGNDDTILKSDTQTLTIYNDVTLTATFEIDPNFSTLAYAFQAEDLGNFWHRSPWFGYYFADFYPWVYHQNLGWVFVHVDSQWGAWLYHERLGWVWTTPDIFPSFFMGRRNEWTFLDTTREKTTMYDYLNQAWFEPDTPISIFGNALPSNGGEINGLGDYYRWDLVTLEAKPSANFNFGGWSGDISGVKKSQTFEAIRNMEVDASFIPLPSAGTPAKEVVSGAAKALDKMDLTEAEKKKSIAELLIFGKSPTSGLSIETSE